MPPKSIFPTILMSLVLSAFLVGAFYALRLGFHIYKIKSMKYELTPADFPTLGLKSPERSAF